MLYKITVTSLVFFMYHKAQKKMQSLTVAVRLRVRRIPLMWRWNMLFSFSLPQKL